MAGTLPPLFTITSDDHAGYIAVSLYTFMVLMVCLVVTRVFTRWYVVRYIKLDDALLSLAAVMGVIQSILVQMALKYGLGRREQLVSASDFALYEKYEYAAQILLIATIAVAKISLAYLLQTLMSDKHTTLASRVMLGIVAAWGFASVMALAFQCSLPNPWNNSGRCVNQAALHLAIGAFNILTDVGLIILPAVVFLKVQDKKKAARVVALFAVRIVTVIVTAIQLSYVAALFTAGADQTWENINPSIWDQIMMNMSICSTALPSLGRLIVDFQPNLNTFAITNMQRPVKVGDKYAYTNSFSQHFNADYGLGNTVQTSVLGSRVRAEDTESVQGLREDGLRQNVIQQTVGFEVKYTES